MAHIEVWQAMTPSDKENADETLNEAPLRLEEANFLLAPARQEPPRTTSDGAASRRPYLAENNRP
jgi:hypothetical protein